MPKDIPWGYGHDRITAMAVDPMRLYVYWEATDSAIAAARAGLGAAGERAWLNVRVYDITGRLFDGTNAHSYFDHRVERHERQWFFGIDKPTSTACAEVGLRSEEGYFVKIARSGRVEFPRNEPVGGGGVEWLSVRGANVSRFAGGAPGGGARGVGPGPAGGGVGAPGGGGDQPAGQCGRLAGMERGRRLPGPARPAPVRAHLAEARIDRGAMDQRLGQDRMGRSRVAHGMGVGPVHLSARRPRGEHRGSGQRRGLRPLRGRTHARDVRPVAGGDSRHRRARRAARARDLGVPPADRGRGRRRADRNDRAAATRPAARSGC